MNYAYYTAAIASAVLIAADLPRPESYAAEGRRVLFTIIGGGIGVIVMFHRGSDAKALDEGRTKTRVSDVEATSSHPVDPRRKHVEG